MLKLLSETDVYASVCEIMGREPPVSSEAINDMLRDFISMSNNIPSILLLIKDERVNLEKNGMEYLKIAINNNNFDLIKILLQNDIIKNMEMPDDLINYTLEKKYIDIFKFLLMERKLNPTIIGKIMKKAVADNCLEIVQMLLSDSEIDLAILNDGLLARAICNYHTELAKLLLSDPRIDPSIDDNNAIQIASRNNQIEIIKILLSDPRVDPSTDKNNAIKNASRNGHVEVVRLLLADPRVDPSAGNNDAIEDASYGGHIEVVKLLLTDRRVNPSSKYNYSIRNALTKGHIEIAELLLSDHRFKIGNDYDNIYEKLQKYDNVKIMKLLELKKCSQLDPKYVRNFINVICESAEKDGIKEINLCDENVTCTRHIKSPNDTCNSVLPEIIDAMKSQNITNLEISDGQIRLTFHK